ncbi:hypothetical protein DPMN_135468 [Dreissena polymorpha]|uniref:Uncharacterized protein n=1 Tax=Dreissena polymorpha TaxID=45954 RepID=A0A9D4G1Y7_DREPO|nr:hypothetical protein DPMN_135468 [Dreissena polymorpha]
MLQTRDLTNDQSELYVHIRKNAPPLGSHFFQANIIIFELIQDIIETNLLSKFHEDWTINLASRVLTRKNAPPLVAMKIAPPLWWPYIIWMNLLTEFHEDRTINVASRVLTRFYYSLIKPYKEKCPAPWCHFIQANVTIFELIQDIIKTNLLTKFHQDWTINEKCPAPWRPYWTINVASRVKNAPPLGSHVFQAKATIFELIKDISGTNLLSKFHEDRKINVASRVLTRKNGPPPGGHVFQPTGIIFELVQDIIGINTINVASRVLTRFYYSHIRKNAPPPGGHVF